MHASPKTATNNLRRLWPRSKAMESDPYRPRPIRYASQARFLNEGDKFEWLDVCGDDFEVVTSKISSPLTTFAGSSMKLHSTSTKVLDVSSHEEPSLGLVVIAALT